jgi:hypothetical protein
VDDTRIEQAKFEGSETRPTIDTEAPPWSYGEDRITVIVRDPESAYLYWECTDEGIASARSRLGRGGPDGWCNLRVYDTTGRDFDGTNANDYFDIGVDRTDREYYLMIRRPGSSMHAEIGVKTHEGFFQPIVRSGRAEFPRNVPSSDTRLEWMTVTSEGAPPSAAPYRSRYAGEEPPLPGREGAGYLDVWRAAYAPSFQGETGASSSFLSSERHAPAHIERWWLLDEWRAEWGGALRFLRGEHFDPRRIAIELLGGEPEYIERQEGQMIVYGPWRVQIRGVETHAGRRVIATWSVRWVRATNPMIERWARFVERRVLSGGERDLFAMGASEAHALLERGASELLRVGASERLWMGASEWSARGASETLGWGASRLLWLGASEMLGGSERIGGSEKRVTVGGSESVGGSAALSGGAGATPAEKWAVRPEGRR